MNEAWIWSQDGADDYDQYVYFRKQAIIPTDSETLFLRITAGSHYKLFVDGMEVGRGPAPSSPEFPDVDFHEIMHIGGPSVCIAVEAYYLGNTIPFICDQNQELPGLWFSLDCLRRGITIATIGMEGTKVLRSPSRVREPIRLDQSRISLWGGFRELYVAAKEPVDWRMPKYDDSEWPLAVPAPEEKRWIRKPVVRDVPFPLLREVKPVAVLEVHNQNGLVTGAETLQGNFDSLCRFDASRPGSFPSVILDFGREVVGYPRINVSGPVNGNLSLWYGETLDLARTDTIILAGGPLFWETYQRRAFRYMKVSVNGCDVPLELTHLSVRETGYPFERKGCFMSSDALFDQMYETSLRTAEAGTHDHIEDCPMREKSLWLGDARVAALLNYWTFADPRIIRSAIRKFGRLQRPDGSIPPVGPQQPEFLMVDYCAYYVMMVREHWYYTLDVEFTREIFPVLQRLMTWFEGLENTYGLIDLSLVRDVGSFLDWASLDKRGEVTIINCLYYDALIQYAEICEIAGNSRFAIDSLARASKLKGVIQERLYDPARRLYADCRVDDRLSLQISQQSNLIAAFTGVAEVCEARSLIERIFADTGAERIKGAFLLNFVVDYLLGHGFRKEGAELLRTFWGGMLRRGATTWWETFDPASPQSSVPYAFGPNCPTTYSDYIPISACHSWGGGPSWILPKHVLGIDPLEAGFRKIRFRPGVDLASHATGSVPTPFGPVQVSWSLDEDRILKWSIDKPDAIEIVVDLDNLDIQGVQEKWKL